MKKPLDLDKLEDCRKASNDLRRRGTVRNRETFAGARKIAAAEICEIDAGLSVLVLMRDLARQRKPFGMPTPRKGSGKFSAYLSALDAKMRAHKALKERFWIANFRLAIVLARKYDYGLVPFADLMQEGLLGLMKAVERFDYRKGFKFSTYGTWWLRHALNRYTANHGRTIRWPAHLVTSFEKLKRTHNKLSSVGEPTDAKSLSEASGIKLKRVEMVLSLNTINPFSLDAQPPGSEGNETLGDRLTDDRLGIDEESPLLDPHFKKILSEIDHLPGLEGEIIVKRFGLDGETPRTLREIGDEHRLSRERIRQLQERGLERLREYVQS
jgi:RNA polymerase primary sigma factor